MGISKNVQTTFNKKTVNNIIRSVAKFKSENRKMRFDANLN